MSDYMPISARLVMLQRATMDCRDRLQDATIGTRIKNGKCQIVRVTYDQSGNATVIPASEFLPLREAVWKLDEMR